MSGILIRRFGGAPLLLILVLFMIDGHLAEQRDRRLVLSGGQTAFAVVHEPSGLEYVTVTWTDGAGRQRTSTAWTGKPFARQFRERRNNAEQQETIKYVADTRVAPVILSEAAERQRVNTWWIYDSLGMALISGVLTAALLLAAVKSRRSTP